MEKDRIIDQETVWDKKKIIIGVISTIILLGVGIYFLNPYFFSQKNAATQVSKKSGAVEDVEGANTSKEIDQKNDSSQGQTAKSFSLPTANDVQANIATIQQQITHLDAAQIASSSPQVQKIIQDLQAMQEYPKNQAKEMCQQICSKF